MHRVDRLWRGDRDQGGTWETKDPKVIRTSPEAVRSQDSLSSLREAALCHLHSGLQVPVWHSTILLLEP